MSAGECCTLRYIQGTDALHGAMDSCSQAVTWKRARRCPLVAALPVQHLCPSSWNFAIRHAWSRALCHTLIPYRRLTPLQLHGLCSQPPAPGHRTAFCCSMRSNAHAQLCRSPALLKPSPTERPWPHHARPQTASSAAPAGPVRCPPGRPTAPGAPGGRRRHGAEMRARAEQG